MGGWLLSFSLINIDQYIRFCEICGEQRRLHSNTEKAIKGILRICQEKKRFDAILDVAGEDSKLLIQRSFSKGTHSKKTLQYDRRKKEFRCSKQILKFSNDISGN